MDLVDLHVFMAVCQSGSFRRAAQALYLSQPTVSHRVAGLERELGTRLFQRSGRGVHPTPAGAVLQRHVHDGLARLDAGVLAVRLFVAGRAGPVALGAATSTATHHLPQILRRFCAAYPEVELHLRTGRSHDVLALLRAREVDLALVRQEVDEAGLAGVVLQREPILLVAPPAHPLAQRATAPVEALHGARLLLYRRHEDFWATTYTMLRRAGADLDPAIELDSLEAVKAMVIAGMGLALLPASSVQEEIEQGRVAQLEVGDLTLPRRVISLVRLRDLPLVGVVANLWGALAAAFAVDN